eukprot:scaffold63400_cov21-Phaeocystis_antarctica.AAC.1
MPPGMGRGVPSPSPPGSSPTPRMPPPGSSRLAGASYLRGRANCWVHGLPPGAYRVAGRPVAAPQPP